MIFWVLFGFAGLCKLVTWSMNRAQAESDVSGIDDDISANYDSNGNHV